MAILKAPAHRYPKNEKYRDALRRLLTPIDYFRYGELPLAWASLGPLETGQKVLDLSSPKLLSFHLAAKGRFHITATDLLEENLVEWRLAASAMDLNGNITLDTADGRNLSYRDASFDHVFSISVLEHIPNDGDSLTMRELSRVLKPGGTLVLTTPCRPKHEDVYLNRDIYERSYDGSQPVFWCRYYNEASIQDRLVKPSGLEPLGMQFLYETIPYWERFCKQPYRGMQRAQMLFWPLIAATFLRISPHFPAHHPLSIAVIQLRKPI